MCNCYGSHVLRSLLSLCKGVPMNSSKLQVTKSSTVLAERLNFKASRLDLLKFLVSGMLNCSWEVIKTLQIDQYSSLVFQACSSILSLCFSSLISYFPFDRVSSSWIQWYSLVNVLIGKGIRVLMTLFIGFLDMVDETFMCNTVI